MIAELDRQCVDVAYSLYQSLQGTPTGDSPAGRLFEQSSQFFPIHF